MLTRLSSAFVLLIGMATFPQHVESQTLSTQGDGAGVSGNIDCSDVSVDYMNDPTLTNAEKLALMDQALERSLSKFDACQTSNSNSGGGGGGGAGGGGADGSSGEGTGDGNAGQGSSTASSDMTGTEQPVTPTASQPSGASTDTSSWTNPNADPTEQTTETDPLTGQPTGTKPLDNGKLPDDIPPADNDSILEAQIRQAAVNEKDPEVQKKLWNEYRKYKGLPKVE